MDKRKQEDQAGPSVKKPRGEDEDYPGDDFDDEELDEPEFPDDMAEVTYFPHSLVLVYTLLCGNT